MIDQLLIFYGTLNLMIHFILFIGWQFGLVGFGVTMDKDDET